MGYDCGYVHRTTTMLTLFVCSNNEYYNNDNLNSRNYVWRSNKSRYE